MVAMIDAYSQRRRTAEMSGTRLEPTRVDILLRCFEQRNSRLNIDILKVETSEGKGSGE